MSRQEDRVFFSEFLYELPNLSYLVGVESNRWLIEDQYFRIVNKGIS